MADVFLPEGFVIEDPTKRAPSPAAETATGTPTFVPEGYTVEDTGQPQLNKSYWTNQTEMAGESFDQMGRGVGQLSDAFRFAASGAGRGRETMTPEQLAEHGVAEKEGVSNLVKGFGNTVQGGLGYLASPISAALRTAVGQPVENLTGIPKEYAEFAAGFALPIPSRVPTRTPKGPPAPTTAGLFDTATKDYNAVRASGVEYAPETAGALADHAIATMRAKGSFEHLAPTVHQTIDVLRTGKPVSINEVKSVLEALSELRTDPDGKIRRAAGIAADEIKAFIANTEPKVAEQLATANANYAAGARARDIERLAEVSDLRTGRAGYGGNAVNAMRQVLSPIVEAAIKGNAKGFSPTEIAAIREIVEGTPATNVLRGIGGLSPSKGGIQAGIALATRGVSAAIGDPANRIATAITRRQVDDLVETIRKRSPAYADAVGNSSANFFNAADVFRADPSRANLIKVLASSRTLASGMERGGVQISSGDLLRLLGAKPGSSDEENP